MVAPRSLFAILIGGVLACMASRVQADHVEWFNPLLPKITGGAIVAGSTPQALRIQNSGSPFQSGTVTIPLSLPSNTVVDSVYLCYRASVFDPGVSAITQIVLRTMALPTATATLLTHSATHQNTTGECLGLDVANAAPFGAPDIQIAYSLPQGTFVEIGAIGIKLTNVQTAVSEPIEIARSSLWLGPSAPNPFSRRTRIEYEVSEPSHVRVQVIDVAGRVVRQLVDRTVTAGRFEEWWDGRDGNGQELAAGVYYSRVSSDRESRSRRVIRLP